MTQSKGIAMDRTIFRSRIWCLVLTFLVGWSSIGLSQTISMLPDDNNAAGVDDQRFSGDVPILQTQKAFLPWMIRASGIFGFLILLVSFAMVAIIMMIAVRLRRDYYLPATFIEEFEQQLQAKDYQGAYESAKGSDSFIGRILAAGMGRLSRGYDEAVVQMQQVGDDESMAMEHKIGYLSLIGSIAPMLGLLGTVQGMIFSFWVMANSTTLPRPSDLADGIATASLTTLEGLAVAIPAIVFSSLYRNRLARFLMESGFVADNLMKNFQNSGKVTAVTPRTE